MTKTSSLSISVIAITAMLFPFVSRADLPATFFGSEGSGTAGQNIQTADNAQDKVDAGTDAQCAGSSCQVGSLAASDEQESDTSAGAAGQGVDLLAITGAAALLLAAAAFAGLLRIRKNKDG